MKQIIVMVSMVILGLAIAGFVDQYKATAQTITDNTRTQITTDLNSGE